MLPFFITTNMLFGQVLFARTFGGTLGDVAQSITQTFDGGYAVTGRTSSFGAGNYDLFVIKLNPDGSLAWARTFGGMNRDYARSITQTTDGDYLVAGETESFSVGGGDFHVLKVNPDGSLAWARTFGGTSTDYSESVTQTSDGGYVVTGYTWSFGTGEYDFLVLKLDPDGNYPDCVRDCSPIFYDVSLSTFMPSVVGNICFPSTSSPNPTVGTPSLSVTDACMPVSVEENDFYLKPQITCSSLPGVALFVSHEDIAVKIYKPDGRLAYSGELRKGENRISLERGVYLWMAGTYRGKAVVR